MYQRYVRFFFVFRRCIRAHKKAGCPDRNRDLSNHSALVSGLGVCWIPFRVVCRPQLPGCRVVRQSCVLVRVSSRRGRFDGFFRLLRPLLQGGFAAIGPKEVSDDTFSSRKIVIFRGMFSRCCIGLLLLSLLPAFVPARETPPRSASRYDPPESGGPETGLALR